MKFVLISVILCGLLARAGYADAAARVIASCTLGEGHSYYQPSPILPAKDAGWAEDGWKSARARLQLVSSGGRYDIISRGDFGQRSAVQEGGKIQRLDSRNPDLFQIVVIYPLRATTEVFTFILGPSGDRKVLWTSARTGAELLGPKVGAYVGTCD